MVSIANPPNSGKAQGVMGHHLHDRRGKEEREREKEEIGQRESEEEGSTRPVATSSSPAAEAVARAHRESERAREIRRHDDTIHKDHARVICGKH
jgi:hypothetical protein